MTRIIIKNVGPIENVDFKLNKINVLMGPQSSGKSTIAKIISYCQWAEKRFLLDGEFKYDVREQLLEFHRLSENYFTEESFFQYESDFTKIAYTGKLLDKTFEKKNTKRIYKSSKNIYIPSERNFVSVIPNLAKYKETNDNIMSFVYDWFSAKRTFNKNNSLPVLNLGVSYYNIQETDTDVLLLKNNKEIMLREGSSGLQSIIPLIALIEYLTKYIYENSVSNSVEEYDSFQRFLTENLSSIIKRQNSKVIHTTIESLKNLTKKEISDILNSYIKAKNLSTYNKTNLIIEEPEQNLFPTTQRDLVNYLFSKMTDRREHSLLLTTHSPYILYSINNCLMGYNIKNNIPSEEREELKSNRSWTSPTRVSLWQVKDGGLISVKDEKTQTVTKHYFNEITKDIMDEYYEMLNHFNYEG